ncbi:hypothetical protein RB195_011565 [Necator americanus]|uniref:Uncharacterized protein n=1 Tax=Necator americanus TaxID=51031 RepID=A0ABR1D366_NECAM
MMSPVPSNYLVQREQPDERGTAAKDGSEKHLKANSEVKKIEMIITKEKREKLQENNSNRTLFYLNITVSFRFFVVNPGWIKEERGTTMNHPLIDAEPMRSYFTAEKNKTDSSR